MDFLIPYSISAGTIILGFIALLTQKVYVDKDTKEATEIEIPLFGKMKSNIPALVFVFLGAGIALWVFNKQVSLMQEKSDWTISGSFDTSDGSKIDWQKGSISLIPRFVDPRIDKNGYFSITVPVDKGKDLSDVFQFIDYTSDEANVQINTKEELEKYKHKDASSKIKYIGGNSWEFKPIAVTPEHFGSGQAVTPNP